MARRWVAVGLHQQLDAAAVDSALLVDMLQIESGASAALLADEGEGTGQVVGHADEDAVVGNAGDILFGRGRAAGRESDRQGESDQGISQGQFRYSSPFNTIVSG